ncbi:MAG: metallophosphoesterase family protein [Candidatus Omnitrophota bacterium]
MRYGIFSDIHSNLEALERVIQAYQKEEIDEYFCLGDVVGYAADPKECVRLVKELSRVTIAGNHDWASVGLYSREYFNEFAKEAIAWTGEHLDEAGRIFLKSLKLVYINEDLTLAHGTLDSPQDFRYISDSYSAWKSFRVLENNICFVGHSHIAGVFIQDKTGRIHYTLDFPVEIKKENKYIVNAGSVGQPRDSNPKAAYCIFDTRSSEIWIKRVEYDIKTAGDKIIRAGLPEFCAARLLWGK